MDEREGIGQTHLLMLGEHDKQKIEGRKGRGVGKGGTVEGNTFLFVSEEIGRTHTHRMVTLCYTIDLELSIGPASKKKASVIYMRARVRARTHART